MSNINLRLPEYLHEHIRELAKQEGVSINQLITLAVAEKVSALGAVSYLEDRASRASEQAFKDVLASIPDQAAEDHEVIPDDLKAALFR